MLTLVVTSIIISRSLFSFLPIANSFGVCQLYAQAAYWALVIVAVHVGMRWPCCIVPTTSFAEPDPVNKPEGGRTPNAWFALNEEQPLFWFAGICVPQWTSVRKVKEGLITTYLYGFLTTEPNGIVAPIHQKAMPVILRNDEEVEIWLTAP